MRYTALPDEPLEGGGKGVVPPRNEKVVGSIPTPDPRPSFLGRCCWGAGVADHVVGLWFVSASLGRCPARKATGHACMA